MSIVAKAAFLKSRYLFRREEIDQLSAEDLEAQFHEFLDSWPEAFNNVQGSIEQSIELILKIEPVDSDEESLDSKSMRSALEELAAQACYLNAMSQETGQLREYIDYLSLSQLPESIEPDQLTLADIYLMELESELAPAFSDIHGRQDTLCTIIACKEVEEERAAENRPKKSTLQLKTEEMERLYPLHSQKKYSDGYVHKEFRDRVGGRYPWISELEELEKQIKRAETALDDIVRVRKKSARYIAREALEDYVVPLAMEFSNTSSLYARLLQRADHIIYTCRDEGLDDLYEIRPRDARRVKSYALKGLRALQKHFTRLTSKTFGDGVTGPVGLHEWVAHNELTKLGAGSTPNPGYRRRT